MINMVMKLSACILVLSLVPAAFAPAGELRVAAAAVDLQADDSMVVAGGIHPRRVRGQEAKLRATAVVIEKPPLGKLAIVACDVLFVTRDYVDAALAEIEKTTGIPSANVLVGASHTHHAPSTAVVHGYGRDEVFCRRLRKGIVEAVQQANAKLAGGRSRFYFHLGEEKTVGANSRLLLADNTIHWVGPRDDAVGATGPFDPQLPILAFRGPDDKLRALIYNHSTHTIGTRRGNVRSPGFYGLAAQELEDEWGGAVCFLEGASGSTHNIGGVSTDTAVKRLKKAITDGLARAEPRAVEKLASVKRRFTFKVRTFDEATEEEKVASYCRKRIPRGAESTIKVFRNMRKLLQPQQGQKRETWLQAVVIGDVAVVAIPGEYFTSLGVLVKKRSPFEYTYVATLSNDWIGYLPDREGHKLGGYQTWMGLHSYAEIGTGERIADEVVAMLQELAE